MAKTAKSIEHELNFIKGYSIKDRNIYLLHLLILASELHDHHLFLLFRV